MNRLWAIALLALLFLAGCEQSTSANAPQVIAFSATWCNPCQRDKPALRVIEAEGFDLTEFDWDTRPDARSEYQVTHVPTYFVYDADGRFLLRTGNVWAAIRLLRSLR